MDPLLDPSTLQDKIQLLLSRGKGLAKKKQRREARSCFDRILDVEPDHVEAHLWLAALAQEPRQSVRYLNRVLELTPDNATARAGLEWAQKRVEASQQIASAPSSPEKTRGTWLDTLLVSGIAMVAVAACVILSIMVWQSPETVRAAYQPTATATRTATMTPTQTFTPTPTVTPTSTATSAPTPLPTATPTPEPTPTATKVPSSKSSSRTSKGVKWIEIDLSEQKLTAYEGKTSMLKASVSTGISRYPTPLGEYKIIRKVRRQVMSGPGYYLPNVQFVSYFYRGYAIHGTYWHNNFGRPMSHGCVNMTNKDAKWLYQWAPKGTRVVVRR